MAFKPTFDSNAEVIHHPTFLFSASSIHSRQPENPPCSEGFSTMYCGWSASNSLRFASRLQCPISSSSKAMGKGETEVSPAISSHCPARMGCSMECKSSSANRFSLSKASAGAKSPVGIHPEFHLASRKMPTDETQQVQFLLETDGTDFQLDTTEAGFQLFPDLPVHGIMVAHPYQPVDADTLFTARKGRIPQGIRPSFEMAQSRLQPKQHGGVFPPPFRIDLPRTSHLRAYPAQHAFVIRQIVYTQLRQGSAFAPSLASRTGSGCHPDVPRPPLRVHSPRRARRLFEMEKPGENIYTVRRNHNSPTSATESPVSSAISSADMPFPFHAQRNLPLLFFSPSARPAARPSASPFSSPLGKSSIPSFLHAPFFPFLGISLHRQVVAVNLDALVILHPVLLERAAMSTIFSNFSNTDFLALNGNLCNVSIFFNTYIHRSKIRLTLLLLLGKRGQFQKDEAQLVRKRLMRLPCPKGRYPYATYVNRNPSKKFMKNTPYTALSRNCQSAPRARPDAPRHATNSTTPFRENSLAGGFAFPR